MEDKRSWYVYVLEGLDGSFYSGITWRSYSQLKQCEPRLGGEYTHKHGLRQIAYFEEHENLLIARQRERELSIWYNTGHGNS